MTRLTVGFIVLCVGCALAIMWTMSAIHNICGAIQAILDIMHSRDKIENLACQRIVELQADKGRLIDENKQAKEHIRTLISCLIDWVQEGDKYYCHIADAEAFLKE